MEDLGEQEVRSDSVAWEVDDQYSDIEEMEVEGAGAGAGVDADADAEDVEGEYAFFIPFFVLPLLAG